MKLKKIAEILNYEVVGNGEVEINSIKYPSEADENSIVINYSVSDVRELRAGAFLARSQKSCEKQNYLVCSEITGVATIKIVKLLIEDECYVDYTLLPKYVFLKDGIYVGADLQIGKNTSIAPLTVIGDNVQIGDNCKIESGVYIGSGTVIGNNVTIRSGSKIGSDALYYTKYEEKYDVFVGVGIVIIADCVEIGSNTVIQRGTFSNTCIAECTKIGDMVDIGHDVKIGENCRINSQSGIAGNSIIGNRVCIYGQVGISDFVSVGDDAVIMARTVISKPVEQRTTVSGNNGWEHREELRFQAYMRKQFRKSNR